MLPCSCPAPGAADGAYHECECDHDGGGDGDHGGELDPDFLPHSDGEGFHLGAGEEDREDDLVEGGDEGEGGGAGDAGQDERPGDGAEDAPGCGAQP